MSTGPRDKAYLLKHGRRTKEAMAERRETRRFIREVKALLAQLK